MSFVKYTKTATFLFPLLEIPRSLFDCDVKTSFGKSIMTTRFLNAYLIDTDLENEYNDGKFIYVIIKCYQDKDFVSFYSTLIGFDNYVDEYEVQEFIVMIFSVPEKFIVDFNLILDGKYSQISPLAKQLIMKNNFYSNNKSTIPLILGKSTALKESWEKRLSNPNSEVDLKDQEVWPIINLDLESFNKAELRVISKKSKIESSKEFE
jgi:hypothetical protein